MKVSRFLKLHCSSCLVGEFSVTHCLNYRLNSPHLEAELKLDITRVVLYSFRTDHTQKTVLLLRQEYRAMDKSRDSQPVLLVCDIVRLRGNVFTGP
jgi:hypothetical protein